MSSVLNRWADAQKCLVVDHQDSQMDVVWAEDGDAECLMSGGFVFRYEVIKHGKATLKIEAHEPHHNKLPRWRFFDPVKPWVELQTRQTDGVLRLYVDWAVLFGLIGLYMILYVPFSEHRAAGSVPFRKKHSKQEFTALLSLSVPCWYQMISKVQMRDSGTTLTVLGTNISSPKALLKMIFLLPRWDMLVPRNGNPQPWPWCQWASATWQEGMNRAAASSMHRHALCHCRGARLQRMEAEKKRRKQWKGKIRCNWYCTGR